MNDDFHLDRGRPEFWENLGLDTQAANAAAMCFPEGWHGLWYRFPGWGPGTRSVTWEDMGPSYHAMRGHVINGGRPNYDVDELIRSYCHREAHEYRTSAWHPAFWYAQGHGFDEMARRAVAANTMLNLSKQANVQPEAPDPMPEVLMALMSQSRPQLPPPRYEEFVDAEPLPQELPSQQQDSIDETPFNREDFPRMGS